MHHARKINELRELAWSQRLRSELLGEVVSRAERAGIRDWMDRSFLAGIGEFLLNELVRGDMHPHKKDGSRPKKNPRRKSKDHDPVQLSNILQAVQRSRSTGGTWNEAMDAARKLGYKGTLPRLMRLARDARTASERRR